MKITLETNTLVYSIDGVPDSYFPDFIKDWNKSINERLKNEITT